MKSRTKPYDIDSVRGYPDALQIYRIPASSFWQVRYFIDGKYIWKSTGTEDKADAITKAKELFDSVRFADRLDQQKHPHTFSAAARKFVKHQESLVTVGDIDQRNQYEDQKNCPRIFYHTSERWM